jgi:uncharacterized membrane protein
MFGLAMVPVSELRGAIPLGLAYDIPWYECYILCCIANFIPVPFILLLIKKVIKWMAESKVEFFKKVSLWIQNKADKNKDKVNRYGVFGLILFVAIPLPMTGAWTGALVAAVTNMKFGRAVICCITGILIAGTIVTLISTGALSALNWMLGSKLNVA